MEMRCTLSVHLCSIAIALLTPGLVQAGTGFYLSSDLGVNFAPVLKTVGGDNDRASRYDEYFNPNYATTEGYDPHRPDIGDSWKNRFDSSKGILAGAAVGYRLRERYPKYLLGGFRLEAEYFFRSSEYDQTVQDTSVGEQTTEKATGETELGLERIGAIDSHNVFVNLYFDYINSGRFTPYLGIGIGTGSTDVDYGALYKRFSDPKFINTGNGYLFGEALAEYKSRLAGTATIEQAELSDTLHGYQALLGVDYALTDTLSLGLKGRWVAWGSFSDGGSYDQLRSHPSNLRLNGSEPVTYRIRTDDMKIFAVSLNLKYGF